MRAQRVVVAAAAAAAVTVTMAAPGNAATGSTRPTRVRVASASPRLAASAKPLRNAPATAAVSVRLYLSARNKAALAAAVKAVSDPRSSSYRHYLSPAQYRAQYAPDAKSEAAVRAFLAQYGLKVTSVPANRAYVEATGTVAQAQKAFGTTLKEYSSNGRTVRSTASPATVPAALAGTVSAVTGLSTREARIKPSSVDRPTVQRTASTAPRTKGKGAPPSPAFVNARPCSAYWAEKVATTLPSAFGAKQPYAPCGYVPKQLQGAYGLTRPLAKGFDGRGVTVAITDAYASPTILADANTYAVKHGQKPFAKGQFKQVLPAKFQYGYDDTSADHDACGEQGWYGEETLDVEAVHAVAPGARVTYVASASCTDDDFLTALNTVVDNHLASVVTNSWGGSDEGAPEYTDLYQGVFFQGALEGIGFYFSSGDSGDASAENDGVPTTQAPANSTLVTAVGGTSIGIGAKNQRLFETGWSTARTVLDPKTNTWTPAPPGAYQYGGGGGTSQLFEQPWYQEGVVPARLANRFSSTAGRVVPDVSAIGDPNTGFLVGQTQTFPDKSVKYSEYRIGGTSLASPVFAGIMAIADQVSGRAHGFANPALYSLYGTKAYYDPQSLQGVGVVRVDYVNSVDDKDGLRTTLRTLDAEIPGTVLRTTKGYDDMTGVGTPNGEAFLRGLGIVR